ncbi:amidohydrolase [Uliginosibacterium aquaticum]|uniref:Amidohydrolase n=1 Tax=Uliginosibacterium aquaticum TaxID=2731212 RepID=A0ABX2IE57_9RHOO|nr:amidohydrolase [Uliginosibacterium aquaticum]NSL54920.1 amidohydrolase [Uliginosibacterium aquaticum]
MKPQHFRLALGLSAVLASLAAHADGAANALIMPAEAPVTQQAEIVIYPAKRVITMEKKQPEAAAVAVSGKRILAVGTVEELKRQAGTRSVRVDESFKDKIIMPGFLDQHLHPVLGALTLATEIIAPEDWALPGRTVLAANSEAEYRSRLKAADAALKDPNEPLISWGYHKLWHGKLDRATLDQISSTRPIIIWQRSCHEFIVNTAALKYLNITEADVTGKGDASKMANFAEGHFWEQGLNLVAGKILKVMASPERLSFGLRQMVAYEHSHGVTAYNEPGAIVTPDMWKLYQQILGADSVPMYTTFLADGRAIIDRVGLDAGLDEVEKTIALAPEDAGGKVMFFPKQIKLFADGAIISQLMQMKQPYTDGHHGEWIIPPAELEKRAKLFWDAGYQIHVHVNGDLGLEVVLATLKKRMKEAPRQDHRFVVVHFANSNEQQIAKIGKLGAIVSANPYYPTAFADKYADGLGKERADKMVRAASVLKVTPHLSFHSDLPMAPSDPLYLAWTAVNRITQSGRVAAPEQRISVDAALRGVTIEAAYSWRKEDLLGSIKPGKIANLTVLEADPYKVDPKKLKDIPVWGTVFEGRVFPVPAAYRAKPGGEMPKFGGRNTTNAVLGKRVSESFQHAHDDGDEACHLAELSQLAVLAYSENLAGR